MENECLICNAPLEYLENDELMECAICHKKEHSKTRCVNGHYVCNECHTAGIDVIISLCLEEKSKNPVEIIEKMMAENLQNDTAQTAAANSIFSWNGQLLRLGFFWHLYSTIGKRMQPIAHSYAHALQWANRYKRRGTTR